MSDSVHSTRASRKAWVIVSLIVLALIAVTVWRIRANQAASHLHRRSEALVVATAPVTTASVPIELKATGEVASRHTVSVVPQVSGILEAVNFREGQMVRKNQILFRINAAPYRAALASARAAWVLDESIVKRDAKLVPHGYIAPEAYETAVATAEQAKAALHQAEINLSYTTIRAPISGLTGSLSVRSGNLVSPSMTTPLVTINQMSPILVQFALPQGDLESILHYRKRDPIIADVLHPGDDQVLGSGPLVFIDNTVNTLTGTILYKARLPNRPIRLWPGQYVNVRLILAVEKGVRVIPDQAVQVGQNGRFIYEIEKGRAVIVPVVITRDAGGFAVLGSKLPLGTTVITEVPETLRNGMAVIPRTHTSRVKSGPAV
ncbi:MAG: efflux RND transporter periplasmic adaptor subunit [Gammaproteobacteria bacterium]